MAPTRGSARPPITAVHVCHVAQKATTQRDGRAASLRRTGRRRASAGKAAGDRWFCPTVGICLPPGHRSPARVVAYAARDADEINRLQTWLWLDGPGQPEGRVGLAHQPYLESASTVAQLIRSAVTGG